MRGYPRLLVFLAAMIATGSAIVGCGPAGSGGAKNEIFLLMRGTPAEMALWKKVIAGFDSANRDCRVRMEYVPFTEYFTKIQTMIAGGSAPDVIFIGPPEFNEFVRLNAIVPLDDFIAADKDISLGTFYPGVVDAYRIGGKLYALPNDAAIFAAFYNKDLFDQSGVPYPGKDWTWKDFLEKSIALTKKDSAGMFQTYGCIFGNYFLWMWQNGGDFYDNNVRPTRSVFNSPANRETFQFLSDLIHKYKVAPFPTDQAFANWFEVFKAGKVAIYITGHWEFPQLRETPNLRWDVAELPRGKIKANLNGGSGFCVTSLSKNRTNAYRLVKYLTCPSAQKILLAGGFSTPALRTPDFTKEFLSTPENNQAFLDAMSCLKMPVIQPGVAELNTMILQKTDLFWMEKISLDQLLQDVDRLLAERLNRRN